MNSVIVINALRFIGLVVLQGLVFQNVGAGWENFPYLNIILFPLFILLLPMRTPKASVILLGFLIGIFVDIFYNSMGLHASAAVFTAFARPYVLNILEPRGGYNVNYSPTAYRMGLGWFLRYASILMFSHLFFYFSVEAFTFVYFVDILIKTIVSFIVSMIFILIYQLILNPVD